jgi:hypothetical protein
MAKDILNDYRSWIDKRRAEESRWYRRLMRISVKLIVSLTMILCFLSIVGFAFIFVSKVVISLSHH